MSRDVRTSHPLPGDVEQAFAVMTGEQWAATKAERLDDGARLESREVGADGGVTVRTTRGLPAGLPGFLEKLIPDGARAGQLDTWGPPQLDGSRQGTWRADVPGAPVDLSGRMRLVPTASGCDYVVEVTAKVKVPLVGGKAEQFVVQATEKAVAAEAGLVRDLLS